MSNMRTPGLVRTISGKMITLADIKDEDIDVTDIAWGLGRIPRYNGHTTQDWSVALHSVVASYCVPKRLAMEALFHDAAEAYMGDVIWPVKSLFPEVEAFENRLMSRILDKFQVPHIITRDAEGMYYLKSKPVAEVDSKLFEHECHSFGWPGTFHQDIEDAWLKAAKAHEQYWWAPSYAFLERYAQLGGENFFDKDGFPLKTLTTKWFPDDDGMAAEVDMLSVDVARALEQEEKK